MAFCHVNDHVDVIEGMGGAAVRNEPGGAVGTYRRLSFHQATQSCRGLPCLPLDGPDGMGLCGQNMSILNKALLSSDALLTGLTSS